jgi:DNA-binding NtrC family response regulator
MALVLVCDDDELAAEAIADQLTGDGHDLLTATNGEDALLVIANEAPDVVVTDVRMPRLDGLGVLRVLATHGSRVPVIVMTAHGAADTAIEATKLGAFAYLAKPVDLGEISLQVARALAPQSDVGLDRYGALLGRSEGMRRVFDVLARLEDVASPTVLITGETGTGKDVVARAIHGRGRRKEKPFLAIDCAAMPDTLIESELFGHERGSFTDARQQKRGLFELAKGGVILLDEIGEMPLQTQAKLLRAIETRSFRRVGGTSELQLDAAIMAATNRDLRAEVKAGHFREDLFFRLNVIPIPIPPLRERGADVDMLARHLVDKVAAELERDVRGIDTRAIAVLLEYSWPGNVRELRNVVERAIIMKKDAGPLTAADLPPEIRRHGSTLSAPAPRARFELPEGGIDLAEVEHQFILQALARAHGNQTKAASLLGISRFALRYRLEKRGGDR